MTFRPLKSFFALSFLSLALFGCASVPTSQNTQAALAEKATRITPEVQNVSTTTYAEADFAAVVDKLKGDLWDRIRRGYGMPDLDNELVNNQVAWYSSRSDYIRRMTERASLYLYHVVEELEKRGMPTELALLPFIESAFNPQAISSAKASGMWQFIPSTGRYYDLKQNMFQDERRSVLESTDAALTYLQKLYGMFGDWHLALAAYNWGEGSVQRAIKKQEAAGLPIDFNSMSYLMPKETQNYVPKLQAMKKIISHPEAFNIALTPVDNEPYFVAIDKTRDIDVHIAAQLAELTVLEFKKLNPQFNRPVITGDADTKILLPAENLEIFQANLDKWEGPLSNWTTYQVPKNERVENIAQRLGTQASVIKEVNQISGNMLVKAGSTLLVPKVGKDAEETNDIASHILDNASLSFAHASKTKNITVTATKKDSLASLAKRYKVSTAQIKQWNALKSNTLKAGQKLRLEVAIAPKKAVAKRSSNRVAKNASTKKAKPALVSKRTKKTAVAQVRSKGQSY